MKKGYIIGIIIAVVIIGGGIYAVMKKNDNKTTSTTTTSSTSSQTQPTTSSSSAIIVTKTSSSVGQYLADGSDKALYTYSKDTNGVSNCSGSCIASWPVYEATTTDNLPVNVTVIMRSDGTKQYAYKGMPLYFFTSDSAGQVTGDGVALFSVAKP